MRLSVLLWFVLVLSLGSAGCAGPSTPAPPVDQVTRVRLTVRKFPGGAGAKAPCGVTFTERADIAEVTGWLQQIDWSQEGTDLKVAKVPEQDGAIALTTKEGASVEFPFYWNGHIINSKANRFLPAGNMAKLQQIAQRACK